FTCCKFEYCHGIKNRLLGGVMMDLIQNKNPNAWIAIDHGLAADLTLAPYTLQLKGERSLYQAIADDDWMLILSVAGHITRVGRVLRVRSDLETTTIYF